MGITAQDLAARISRDLAALAEDAGWSTEATPGQACGHYSDPIADALDDAALDEAGHATAATDVTRRVRRAATGYALDKLAAHYAAEINISSDGTNLQLESVFGHIQQLREALGLTGAQSINLRGRPKLDYTAGEGNATDSSDPVIVYSWGDYGSLT